MYILEVYINGLYKIAVKEWLHHWHFDGLLIIAHKAQFGVLCYLILHNLRYKWQGLWSHGYQCPQRIKCLLCHLICKIPKGNSLSVSYCSSYPLLNVLLYITVHWDGVENVVSCSGEFFVCFGGKKMRLVWWNEQMWRGNISKDEGDWRKVQI